MRPRRIIAIAQRDLAQELKGRRGWVLPAIMAGLLLPLSGAPVPGANQIIQNPTITVSGDVPEDVLAIDFVQEVDEGLLSFRRDEQGTLLVRGMPIHPQIRAALDGGEPAVTVQVARRDVRLPNRSLLFALISASTLTGAVSGSIAGERTHKTLVALLAASITRMELICGKALAWGGMGAATALLAATVSIVLGRLDAGWWLLPLPTVPIATVAVGLFLVRRASDLIGGTTVTLRVLPAMLAALGLLASFVGTTSPLAASAIPLGGALMTAGSTWGGHAGPALLSTASTLLTTALCLWLTARDLEESPGTSVRQPWAAAAVLLGFLAALAWWIPIIGPILWTAAGNPQITEQLPARPGIAAGVMGLGLMSMVRGARARDAAEALSFRNPIAGTWGWALWVGVALAITASVSGLVPMADDPLLARARLRMADGMVPVWAGPTLMLGSILADEFLFRGWLQKTVGGPTATVIWTVVKAPFDPIRGLLTGGMLAMLTHRAGGSVLPAILAHGIWALLTIAVPGINPWLALIIGLAMVAAIRWIPPLPQVRTVERRRSE